MLARMLGAARLNVHTYEEVEADKSATLQAILVVIIVSIAIGIGRLAVEGQPIRGLLGGLVYGLLSWALWVLVTYLLGTTVLKTSETHADWGELARTTGFAQTPGILVLFVFIPVIGSAIAVIGLIWRLVAMVVAVRQALDYQSTVRAVVVAVIGYIVAVIPLSIIWARIVGIG